MDLTFKKKIFEAGLIRLTTEIHDLEVELKQYQEAVSEETKSSVGDKYETGRARLHQEQERLGKQLLGKQKHLKHLISLEPVRVQSSVEAGSLVLTTYGLFYFAVGIGELKFEDQKVNFVSLNSPIAQKLMGQIQGKIIEFQTRSWEIIEVI